jgi:Raf kinase inhibitor-like YbhB/YbcL family protein
VSLERPIAQDPYDKLPRVLKFALTSPDVGDHEPLAGTFVGSGGNASPELTWSGAPEGTESFVVSCYDPDAPTPSGFWHWMVANLPATTTSLPRNAGAARTRALPAGSVTVRNDAGNRRYDGAGPPPGDHVHRYYFVVHAVDVPTLQVTPDTSPAVVSFQLAMHALGRAVLVGTYQVPA